MYEYGHGDGLKKPTTKHTFSKRSALREDKEVKWEAKLLFTSTI